MDEKSGRVRIDDDKSEEKALNERREFLRKAGRAAVTVPAAAILLSMVSKRANAVPATSVLDATRG